MQPSSHGVQLPYVHKDAVSHIEFSVSSQHLLVSSWDGSIHIYNIHGTSPESVFNAQFESPITASCFVGQHGVIAGLADGDLIYINPTEHDPRQIRFFNSPSPPFKLCYNSQHHRVVLVSNDGHISLFDSDAICSLISEDKPPSAVDVVHLYASAGECYEGHNESNASSARLGLSLSPLQIVKPHQDTTTSTSAASLQANWLVVSHIDNISLYYISKSSIHRLLFQDSPFHQSISAVAVILEFHSIVVGGVEGHVAIVPFPTSVFRRLQELNIAGVNPTDINPSRQLESFAFKSHRELIRGTSDSILFPVSALVPLCDPPHFLSSGFDGSIIAWDPLNRKRKSHVFSSSSSITAIAVSPSDNLLSYATGPHEMMEPLIQTSSKTSTTDTATYNSMMVPSPLPDFATGVFIKKLD